MQVYSLQGSQTLRELMISFLQSAFKLSKRYVSTFICFSLTILTCSLQPPLWGARAYDAVHLYAIGLNKSLQNGQGIRDGRSIIKNIRSMSFPSKFKELYNNRICFRFFKFLSLVIYLKKLTLRLHSHDAMFYRQEVLY